MEINPDSECECTMIDPTGPITWTDEKTLVGRFRGDPSRFVMVRYVRRSEIAMLVPRDSADNSMEFLVDLALACSRVHTAEEIVSPDGKKVLVRRCVDGPTPTHLFVYDIAE